MVAVPQAQTIPLAVLAPAERVAGRAAGVQLLNVVIGCEVVRHLLDSVACVKVCADAFWVIEASAAANGFVGSLAVWYTACSAACSAALLGLQHECCVYDLSGV
jgi:hypothetical protein